jgi:hypothetical protein
MQRVFWVHRGHWLIRKSVSLAAIAAGVNATNCMARAMGEAMRKAEAQDLRDPLFAAHTGTSRRPPGGVDGLHGAW